MTSGIPRRWTLCASNRKKADSGAFEKGDECAFAHGLELFLRAFILDLQTAGDKSIDVFRGEQIGAGKKSLAYSLTFQSEEKTLTDKVVARQQNNIVKRLERELGAKLRS